jgi:diguanylate cyclase (GGDEF)-like protein/PAS domain S-box-containing protein
MARTPRFELLAAQKSRGALPIIVLEPSIGQAAMPSPTAISACLDALLDMARVVRDEEDLRRVLSRLVALVAELLDMGSVVLNLYRPEWDDFLVVDMHGSGAARETLLGTSSGWADWEPLLNDKHLRCGVYFVPAGSVDWNVLGPPTYVPPATTPPGESAWNHEDALFAVMEGSNGSTLGILSVDEPGSGRRPSDAELRVLHGVAQHAARAMEEAEASARVRRHRRALESLLAVSSELGRRPDPTRAMQEMCDAIRDAFGFARAALAVADHDGSLHRVAACGVNVFEPAAVRTVEELDALCDERFAREGCYLVEPEELARVLTGRSYFRSELNGRGPRAWRDHTLVVPLESHAGRVMGYLWVDEPSDRLLPDAETLHALRTFANQAAMALQVAERVDALQASEERNAAVLNAALDAFVTIDGDGVIVAFNPAAERMFGYPAEEAIGADMTSLLIPDWLAERHLNGFADADESGDSSILGHTMETFLRRADGSELPVELVIARTSAGVDRRYTAYIRDISERRRQEHHIKRLAYQDLLTGLPNRARLEERLGEEVTRARQTEQSVALLYIDLDDFKLINDSFGHSAGDELLRAVAGRLAEVTRERDLLARHGGDEFLLLLRDLGSDPIRATEAVAEKLIAALEEPFQVGNAELWIGASVGISLLPRDAEDADGLLKNADAAMYQAKNGGRGRYALYRTGGPDPRLKLGLTTRLRRALANEELELHYQPLVDLATMEVVSVEALLRWREGDRLIPPGDFIPVAEDTGLIEPIGEWVIHAACAQAAAWERAGHCPQISFNVSPRQLLRPDFTDTVAAAIEKHGIAPQRLVAEITETAFMRHAGRGSDAIPILHELGLRLAIDDFGAAYSSLSRLRDLPVDILKIDRSFLTPVPEDPAAGQIVEAILSLSRALGVIAVAEGIERDDQLDFLRERGCQVGQGFRLGRPAPADEVVSRLPSPA